MLANADRSLAATLRALAAERGIAVRAFAGGWVHRLSRGETVRDVVGYAFPLNSATAHAVAQDKSAAAEVLEASGVACVPHRLVLRPELGGYVGAAGNWAALLEWFHAWNADVVIKPNEGTGGEGVVRARSVAELEAAVHGGLAAHRALAVSPFVPLAMEARAVVLRGEVLLAYAKRRPAVTGDGVRTLGALAHEAGLARVASGGPDAREVVPAGVTRLVDWRHNLGLGAAPEPLAPDAREAVGAVALRAARALGLAFCSIDVARPLAGGAAAGGAAPEAGAEGAASGDLLVMEANAGVMVEHYARLAPDGPATAHRLYGRALDALFPPPSGGAASGDPPAPQPAPESPPLPR